jgi:hypothetical protein
MERREFIALLGMAAAAMPQTTSANARPMSSLGEQLIGSWGFESSVNTRKDGTTFDRWGPSPSGIFMFDRAGNYAQIIIGSESRVFGSKVFCAFGTFEVVDEKKVLLTKITSCSSTRLIGTTQTRDILHLTADQFKYSNSVTSLGATAEVLWKRIG